MNDEVAIVSEIAGTTRDKIESTLNINGIQFRLIDTAGIRDTVDTIEKIGVQKALETIQQADIILYIFDITNLDTLDLEKELSDINRNEHVPLVIIANKSDLMQKDWKDDDKLNAYNNIYISSSKSNSDIQLIKDKLFETVTQDIKSNQESVIVSNSRHLEALEQSKLAIEQILFNLDSSISTELVTQDIKIALRSLGSITGEIDVDKDILNSIFSKFCIGK